MRFIIRNNARPGASIAMAVALLCGTALGTAALETPAFAQKDKKPAAPKLSKGYQKVYAGVVPLINAPAPDEAAIRAAIPPLLAAVANDDDKDSAGNVLLSAGGKFNDYALQLQGLEMMIESGKNEDRLGQIYYNCYLVASNLGDMDAARDWISKAADMGYSFSAKMNDGTTRTITAGDLRVMGIDTYFEEDRYEEGLAELLGWLRGLDAAGQPIEQDWIRKGFATAFNNQMGQESADFNMLFLKYYPSANMWGDAITIQTNFFDWDPQETLDLLRLARRSGAFSPDRFDRETLDASRIDSLEAGLARSYIDYAESADWRRLPGEVKSVLEEGIANGVLEADDVTVVDWLRGANGVIAEDKAGLPALEADARKGSSLNTVIAAGDAFLSYGDAAKAEEFYAKAMTLPGVDAPRTLTRLGIAQVDLGKYDDAIATFGKIEGKRKPIAKLWATYAAQKAAGK